jgi:hypothetical protein
MFPARWRTGVLSLSQALAGAGTVTVLDGTTLLLAGGSVSALNVGGLLYNTGTLIVSGGATGTGTIAAERGGALELGAGATLPVSFAESNVMVTLDRPVGYQGRLVGFGQGDTLVLDGLRGSPAGVINGDTLAVMAGGTTLDTIPLAGNYIGANFTATTAGNITVVTNTRGAPPRDDLSINLMDKIQRVVPSDFPHQLLFWWADSPDRRDACVGIGPLVSVSNSIGLPGSLVAALENEVSLAAASWCQYIAGAVPLRVSLTFINSGDFGSELSEGAPGALIANGQTIDGHAVFIPDGLHAVETGQYAGGASTDLRITVIASAT